MRKMLPIVVSMLAAVAAAAQPAELFRPYRTSDLRMPSVPVFVNDPYFSVWSPYDRLTDGPVRHWTGNEKTVTGLLRVDGALYRFMGAEQACVLDAVAPAADAGPWKGRVLRTDPGDGWEAPSFDDAAWPEETAAFGTSPEYPHVRSRWTQTGSDIYVRRTVEVSAEDAASDLYLCYSHDDVCEIYINGVQVVNTGNTWKTGRVLRLDGERKGLVKTGRNVIAAHCHNTEGGAYLDFGLSKNVKEPLPYEVKDAVQQSVDVMATNTYYTFACGPVFLDLVFTAPMLIDDLDQLSTPVNFVSYQVRPADGKRHDVQFYLGVSPEMSVNTVNQPTVSSLLDRDGVQYARTGTVDQPVLARKGDGVCIDWGYFYLPAVNGTVSVAPEREMLDAFARTGRPAPSAEEIVARAHREMPVLGYVHDFGSVKKAASFALVAYDEIFDIEYMYYRYKGYWARDGKTIFEAMADAARDYPSLMMRCRALDRRIYDDAFASGGKKYAELLSGSFRHVMAAHKLFEDKDGNLLYFSKENNSNGCVNTVDLTYPSAPLFLLYNPELLKGMMTSIFDYSLSGRWTKPFAAHDLGTYPIANGQVYGEDMPLEEAGNMLTLTAMLTMIDGDASYAGRFMPLLRTWADYLSEHGMDPADQLCTDDFAGRLAHNCNLAVKAIMGVAGFSFISRAAGDADAADRYMARAREMAVQWEKDARDGDHYKLTYDRPGTWSQKYNMVWDLLWKTDLFPNGAMAREMASYAPRQNRYGLPLDSRATFAKSDWIMWTAAMSSDAEMFRSFLDPLYDYVNETPSRVPISDLHDTNTSRMIGMYARSVIGGYWMKVLVDRMR